MEVTEGIYRILFWEETEETKKTKYIEEKNWNTYNNISDEEVT